MKNKWWRTGNSFYLAETSDEYNILPKGVYKVNYDEMKHCLYHERIADEFTFSFKLYNLENSFIDRVVKTYNNTKGNLGILLNGQKGTSKSVTAKQIANKLGLPVIIIHEKHDGIASFINELQQDTVIFFDEYEKIYNNYDHSILTVMDGILDNDFRKTFLLTTNDLHVNTNLLQRPGRIRYLKPFGDLSLEVIIEVIDDRLVHKEFKEKCIEFIASLETITIDIVNAVIDEVNIHHESPEAFKDVFNVAAIKNVFNIYKIIEKGKIITEEVLYKEVKLNYIKITNQEVNEDLRVNNEHEGTIKMILNDDVIVIEVYNDDTGKDELQKYRIENVEKKHSAFNNYSAF